jgi:hypothetical protein
MRRVSPEATPAADWSEREFQRWLVANAKQRGWMVREAPWKNRGVNTDADWPDLILVHAERGFFFVECKSQSGKVTTGQLQVLLMLNMAGVEAHTWRPSDHETVLTRLEIKGALQPTQQALG